MTLSQAIHISNIANLDTREDAVNNILINASTYFSLESRDDEVAELRQDAIQNGIVFSERCYHAIGIDEDVNKYCSGCKKSRKK